ncbi:MAG: hypothetical protein JW734_01240 [Candidatus Omnitrophica bacterium]|nr:hypothetical protein [Candidatus Omnitrophota bacterium]
MRIPIRNKAFTLVEIIITASLVTVVGLALYSAVNSGIKIWQRLNKSHAQEEVSVFFEVLSTDLRNSFVYGEIYFIGEKERLEFATLVTTASTYPGLRRGPGQVAYYLDSKAKKIIKEKRNLSHIYKEAQGSVQEVLSKVSSLNFEYYYYDSLRKEYFWLDEWEEESLPLAVRVRLEITGKDKVYKIIRTFNVPLGKKEI